MEKWLKYYLNALLLLLIFSCETNLTKLSKQELRSLSEKTFKAAMYFDQGTPRCMTTINRAIEIDSTNAEAWRELGVPYLKRGMPHKWKPFFDKAVQLDPKTWTPWRGYLYLQFYRDYKKAITDFDASDTLTPNFIDAPQGHSVDYWRGIAYLGLKDYEKSLLYFDKYVNKEIEESGEDWAEVTAFLYRGIAYFEIENYEKALLNFNKMLKYTQNQYADAKYYKVLVLEKKGEIEEAKVLINEAIVDFDKGYLNSHPYTENLYQIYKEDLLNLKKRLK